MRLAAFAPADTGGDPSPCSMSEEFDRLSGLHVRSFFPDAHAACSCRRAMQPSNHGRAVHRAASTHPCARFSLHAGAHCEARLLQLRVDAGVAVAAALRPM